MTSFLYRPNWGMDDDEEGDKCHTRQSRNVFKKFWHQRHRGQ